MVTPDSFKNPPPEPKKNALQLVQELCAMKVHQIDAGQAVPLTEALAYERELVNIGGRIPTEQVTEDYGRADMYPAIESLIMALEMYAKGEASPTDKQTIVDSPGIFSSLMQNAFGKADVGSGPFLGMRITAKQEEERDGLMETFLLTAQDWRKVHAAALAAAAAVKTEIGPSK